VATILTVFLFLPASVFGNYVCLLCPPPECETPDCTPDVPADIPPCRSVCSGSPDGPAQPPEPVPAEPQKRCSPAGDFEGNMQICCFGTSNAERIADFRIEPRWSNPTPGTTPDTTASLCRFSAERTTAGPSLSLFILHSISVTVLLC